MGTPGNRRSLEAGGQEEPTCGSWDNSSHSNHRAARQHSPEREARFMKSEFAPLHKVPRSCRAWHIAVAHSVNVSHSCWRAVSQVELLEGMVGGESLGGGRLGSLQCGHKWDPLGSLEGYSKGIPAMCTQDLLPHQFPTSPLVPMASDPGPREDTGVYETQGGFVCVRLMALLWACSGVMETVFLKSITFLCALHVVQE